MATPEKPVLLVRPDKTVIPVTLHRAGQYVFIQPPVEGLDDYLFTVQHEAFDHPEHGHRTYPLPEPLVPWREHDGRVTQSTLAGLEPLLIDLLTSFGHRVRLTGHRPGVLEPASETRLATFKRLDTGVLDLVRRHDRGLIAYDEEHVSPARLIAQIHRAWPKLSLVVTATRVQDVHALRRSLRRLGVMAMHSTARHYQADPGKVVVATYSTLGSGPMRIEFRDIYIALNPGELFSGFLQFGVAGIKHAFAARMYGLQPQGTHLAPQQRDLVTALFGTERVVVPRHGFRPINVDVVFTTIAGGPTIASGAKLLAVKQQGVWQHPLRNRRLARLARVLADGTAQELRQELPALSTLAVHQGRRRVGVLVESIEHAMILGRSLTGWPIITPAGSIHPAGLSPKEIDELEGRAEKEGDGRNAIVTFPGLAGAGRFDVLLRADAGTGLPPLPEAHWRVRHTSNRRLVIVDANDRHHPLLRQRTRQRRAAYAAAGIHVAGMEEMSALQQFLQGRPEVYR